MSDEQPFTCNQCDRRYKNKRSLNFHVHNAHETKRPFKCEDCGETFALKSILRIHQRKHSNEKPFECGRCKTKFKMRNSLTHHLLMNHENHRPFKCEQCGKTFAKKHILHSHERIHTDEWRLFACDQCTYTTRYRHNIKRHVDMRHSNTFGCKLCNSEFDSRGKLTAHLIIVHNERRRQTNRKCNACGLTFSTEQEFVKHIGTHEPFMCDHCDYQNINEDAVVQHVKAVHQTKQPAASQLTLRSLHDQQTPKKLYSCDDCSAKFVSNEDLIEHKLVYRYKKRGRSAHGKPMGRLPFACDLCGETFASDRDLAAHRRLESEKYDHKSFSCEQCDRLFSTNWALEMHQQKHNEEQSDFDAVNSNEMDRLTHSNATPTECEQTDNKSSIRSRTEHRQNCECNEHHVTIVKEEDTTKYRHNIKRQVDMRRRRTFGCKLCNSEFDSRGKLDTHLITVHNERQRQTNRKCNVCGSTFSTEQEFVKHIETHESFVLNDRVAIMHQSRQSAASQLTLRSLPDQQTVSKYYSCDDCSAKFVSNEDLIEHKLVYRYKKRGRSVHGKPTSRLPFACDLCGETFASDRDLAAHRRLESEKYLQKSFSCEQCDRLFFTNLALEMHQQTHNEEQSDLDAANSDEMDRLTHSNATPAECEQTDNKPTSRSRPEHQQNCRQVVVIVKKDTTKYRHHIKRRVDMFHKKAFRCKVCDSRFDSRGKLNTHLITAHNERQRQTIYDHKSFSCEQCDRLFSTNWALEMHRRTHINQEQSDFGATSSNQMDRLTHLNATADKSGDPVNLRSRPERQQNCKCDKHHVVTVKDEVVEESESMKELIDSTDINVELKLEPKFEDFCNH